MTKEEKQVLLTALCSYLPYNVKCKYKGDDIVVDNVTLKSITKETSFTGETYWDCYFEDDNQDVPIEIVKPYLRPMSSMTEEEWKEVKRVIEKKGIFSSAHLTWHLDAEIMGYFNKRMFDYRGLILMDLALEAPKGMYN